MNEFWLPFDHSLYHKKILSIDWGEKFLGLATYYVSHDPFPLAYGRIKGGAFSSVWKELNKIIICEEINILVIGVPYYLDGKAGSSTKKVQLFINELEKNCTLPIKQQDETLSTHAAEDRMKSSPRWNYQVDLSEIDALSAMIILEDFIRQEKTRL